MPSASIHVYAGPGHASAHITCQRERHVHAHPNASPVHDSRQNAHAQDARLATGGSYLEYAIAKALALAGLRIDSR